jgi:hypothetical protein
MGGNELPALASLATRQVLAVQPRESAGDTERTFLGRDFENLGPQSDQLSRQTTNDIVAINIITTYRTTESPKSLMVVSRDVRLNEPGRAYL